VVLLIGFAGLAFPVANIAAVVGFGALAVQTPAPVAEPALG
jgi:hypothetical protein